MELVAHHDFDVVVIGAGGAGLRAAIEARQNGARTALICKSLLGKAHTVMAEGGIAAALGTVWPEDNWRLHFRDTMRGGKMLNNWRMAQIHALEAPDRVLELEEWGALFDRTPDGRILQRDFGGHRYARLAHVGDRTGLEMMRALQHRAVAIGVDVFMECKIVRLLQDDAGAVNGAVGFWRASGLPVTFGAKAVVLATGGAGKVWKFTTNSWECTGDGMALALWAGADLIDMEAIQFHPTGMVWPPSARGLLVTEAVRGDGGVLRNRAGERFMFDYISPYFAAETADTIEEADGWYTNKRDFRRPPELLPRDEVARAINSEVKAGRGTEHGGVFLDIASRRTAEEIRRLLPSMYQQFKQLADIDITETAMEIGPTCHYTMGGIRVEPDTEASVVAGLYAAGEVAGGMHGSNRLGGNSLSDLVVFGRRAGLAAAERALGLSEQSNLSQAQVADATRHAMSFFHNEGSDNAYGLHSYLQETMQSLVGIVRVGPELLEAKRRLAELARRVPHCVVEGDIRFNPGWSLALDLESMLAVANCTTLSAIARRESRGGHTREDFPTSSKEFENLNMVTRLSDGEYSVSQEPKPRMPQELSCLFEEADR
jgi:succinate dehydrogenase / fumarate reductase flavoprotein subunit